MDRFQVLFGLEIDNWELTETSTVQGWIQGFHSGWDKLCGGSKPFSKSQQWKAAKAYFSLMPHDNLGLAGDFIPAPLSSSFLDLRKKPASGTLLASVQKEKTALLLSFQLRILIQNFCSHSIGRYPGSTQ